MATTTPPFRPPPLSQIRGTLGNLRGAVQRFSNRRQRRTILPSDWVKEAPPLACRCWRSVTAYRTPHREQEDFPMIHRSSFWSASWRVTAFAVAALAVQSASAVEPAQKSKISDRFNVADAVPIAQHAYLDDSAGVAANDGTIE